MLSKRWSLSIAIIFAVFISVWMWPHRPVWADMPETTEPIPLRETASSADWMWMSVKVILALLFILALIVLTIKALAAKNRSWFVNHHFRPLGGISLGSGKSLQLIQIGRSLYVIGVDNEIRLIDKIVDAEEIKAISDPAQSPQSRGKSAFLTNWNIRLWLKKAVSYIASFKSKQENVPENSGEETRTFQQVFDSKIKELSNRNRMLEEWLAKEKGKTETDGQVQQKERDTT